MSLNRLLRLPSGFIQRASLRSNLRSLSHASPFTNGNSLNSPFSSCDVNGSRHLDAVPLQSLNSSRFFSTVEVPVPPSSNHPYKKLPGASASLIYTETDEAPALATFSLLPVITKVSFNDFL